MNKDPLISIVMNCYNGEKYLEESLKSILNQTYENWELIFWDNISTDNSKNIFQYVTTRFRRGCRPDGKGCACRHDRRFGICHAAKGNGGVLLFGCRVV